MPWLDVREYLFDMPTVMAAADLVIGRAGAMTCAELAALGKPSVLVPYPYAAGDHQTSNARVLTDAGAALLQADSDFSAEWLAGQLQTLLNDPVRLKKMGEAAARLAHPQAAAKITECLYQVLHD
jgi:UDP-N-acetylglucosamine--N-acetylmuramyl-(pentapeptide) pyrophosphoryl-undecaprenol N-acetylglucosamine transferase